MDYTRGLEQTPSAPDDLDQRPLSMAAVELPVDYPLPGTQVETSVGQGDGNSAGQGAQPGARCNALRQRIVAAPSA